MLEEDEDKAVLEVPSSCRDVRVTAMSPGLASSSSSSSSSRVGYFGTNTVVFDSKSVDSKTKIEEAKTAVFGTSTLTSGHSWKFDMNIQQM